MGQQCRRCPETHGYGLFYLHVKDKVYAILCEKGDLISVPKNTTHWFDMGEKPDLKCIRFFVIPYGWAGEFTGNDIASRHVSYETFRAAQKLLFGYSYFADLTPLFDGYFDTGIGATRDSSSYRRISDEISVDADQILFLSDSAEELDAAKEAGMQTVRLMRNSEDTADSRHPVCHDFSQIRSWI